MDLLTEFTINFNQQINKELDRHAQGLDSILVPLKNTPRKIEIRDESYNGPLMPYREEYVPCTYTFYVIGDHEADAPF
jgi:hypothetical protein